MPSADNKKDGTVRQNPACNPVQYETSVYQNGLQYENPPFTFHSNNWEPQAAKAMSANSAGYAIGNAGSGETAKKNVEAFKKWSIVPKRLVKSEGLPELTTKVMGHELQFPIAAGPVGVLRETSFSSAYTSHSIPITEHQQVSSIPTASSQSPAPAPRTTSRTS